MFMLVHVYNIIIDYGIEAPCHGRNFVDGLNATDKHLSILMKNHNFPGQLFITESNRNSHLNP